MADSGQEMEGPKGPPEGGNKLNWILLGVIIAVIAGSVLYFGNRT